MSLAFAEDHLRAFVGSILDPAIGCMEMRLFHADFDRGGLIVSGLRYSKTIVGWYDNINALVIDAKRLRGVSGYIIPNPVDKVGLARSDNTLKVSFKDGATKDVDIVVLRWLFIDIDADRPKKDISATDEEFARAIERRDAILAAHPELKRSALWGRSGNGGWIFVRLPDYPNDEEHRKVVADGLASIISRFDGNGVEIDPKCKNPSRLTALPGTLKCKGSNRPERPWRLATFDSWAEGHLINPEPIDLKAWLEEYRAPISPPAAQSSGGSPEGRTSRPSNVSLDDRSLRIYRASCYLSGLAGAVSGQHGHDQTFDAACALVKGFGLSISEARPILQQYNNRCVPPWEPYELDHKLEDADARPDDKLRGYLYETTRNGSSRLLPRNLGGDFILDGPPRAGAVDDVSVNGHNQDVYPSEPLDTSNGPDDVGEGTEGENLDESRAEKEAAPTTAAPEERVCIPGAEDNPHRLARLFVQKHYQHPDGLCLRFWREEFHAWDGAAFRTLPRKEIAAEVTGAIEKEFLSLYQSALIQHGARKALQNGEAGNGDGKTKTKKKEAAPKPLPVTTRLVADVIQALTDLSLLRVRNCPAQPAWLDFDAAWPAREMLPTKNALVHLPSFVEERPAICRPTPKFFAPYALAYDFDPDAADPVEWLKFLNQLWADDAESIQALQEWMGYLLTPDTSQQKIMMMIGPKRSGKGTIVRIIRAMIGQENVVNPTLSSLATHFGLAPLVGRLAAIITDARISGRTDTAVVVERLLSISGEDGQTIDRKYREEITTKVSTRFMLISNELPKMRDASGALVSRMIFLQLTQSFYGREDTGLFDRLAKELPGILQWAIKGWTRLHERGHFIQPTRAMELIGTMEELTSPVRVFLQQCCRMGAGSEFEIAKGDLYNAWRTWCQSKGQEHVGTEVDFGRLLVATVPNLKTTRPRIDGKATWSYSGLRLLKSHETNDDQDSEQYHFQDSADRKDGPPF